MWWGASVKELRYVHPNNSFISLKPSRLSNIYCLECVKCQTTRHTHRYPHPSKGAAWKSIFCTNSVTCRMIFQNTFPFLASPILTSLAQRMISERTSRMLSSAAVMPWQVTKSKPTVKRNWKSLGILLQNSLSEEPMIFCLNIVSYLHCLSVSKLKYCSPCQVRASRLLWPVRLSAVPLPPVHFVPWNQGSIKRGTLSAS